MYIRAATPSFADEEEEEGRDRAAMQYLNMMHMNDV
jgi:hypothetical protein